MRKFHATPRTSLPYFISTLMAGVLSIGSTSAHAGVVVNGYGFGSASVDGWSGANPAPGPPPFLTVTSSGFHPNAAINSRSNPTYYSATAQVGDPGDPNGFRSTNSYGSASAFPLWIISCPGKALAGDDFSGGGSALFNLVKPSLFSASVDLTLNAGTIVNSTTITFTGTFQGDAGTAASLSFSDIDNSSSPTTLSILDHTGAGTLETNGSLLFLGSGSGNPAQSFSFTITDAAGADGGANYLQNYVQAAGDYVVTSVPEPSSIWLLAVGALVVARARQQATARSGNGSLKSGIRTG